MLEFTPDVRVKAGAGYTFPLRRNQRFDKNPCAVVCVVQGQLMVVSLRKCVLDVQTPPRCSERNGVLPRVACPRLRSGGVFQCASLSRKRSSAKSRAMSSGSVVISTFHLSSGLGDGASAT
jgi:hypothetical protein